MKKSPDFCHFPVLSQRRNAPLQVQDHIYYTGKGRVSANGMEMETTLLPRSSWLGPRGRYIKYLASSLNLVSMEMENSYASAAWCRRSSHYITDYLASGLGNGQWRRISRTESQLHGPGVILIDQWGLGNAAMEPMERTTEPGKI